MDTLKVIYNAQDDEFLAYGMKNPTVPQLQPQYEGTDWEYQTFIGLRLSPSGVAISPPTDLISGTTNLVSIYSPMVLAYKPSSNQYFAVWPWAGKYGPGPSESKLAGRLLTNQLTGIGGITRFEQAHDAFWPGVAYNPDDDEYLVTWYDENGSYGVPYGGSAPTPQPGSTPSVTPTPTVGPTTTATPSGPRTYRAIYAQRVHGDGTLAEEWGLLYEPGTAQGDFRNLKMFYNQQSQEYVLVWEQRGEMPGLYVLRLNRSRQISGPAMRVVGPPAVPYDAVVVYNNVANQYLLAWTDARGGVGTLADVYGLVMSAQGQAQGEPFVIRGTGQYERLTDAVYNPVLNEYLVAWDARESEQTSEKDVKTSLQRVSPQGGLLGGPITSIGGVFSLGVNPETGNYLALEQFGYMPKRWGWEPPCIPTLTPTPTNTPRNVPPAFTPIPTPYVYQNTGRVFEISPGPWGSSTYLIIRGGDGGNVVDRVVIPMQADMDEHFHPVQPLMEVWYTAREQVTFTDVRGAALDHIAEHLAVIPLVTEPTSEVTVTPTGTATVTGTATIQAVTTATTTPTSTPVPTNTPTTTVTPNPSVTSTATASPTATATTEGPVRHYIYLPLIQH